MGDRLQLEKRNETGKIKQDMCLKCHQVRLRDARCRGSRRMLNSKNHRNVDKQDCGTIGALGRADTGCSISALPGRRMGTSASLHHGLCLALWRWYLSLQGLFDQLHGRQFEGLAVGNQLPGTGSELQVSKTMERTGCSGGCQPMVTYQWGKLWWSLAGTLSSWWVRHRRAPH